MLTNEQKLILKKYNISYEPTPEYLELEKLYDNIYDSNFEK